MIQKRNALVVGALLAVVVGMGALSFAAVPLYRMFCQATGFGGTTRRSAEAARQILDRRMEIRFNADVNRELPWGFRPNARSLTLKIGETGMTTFNARNESGAPIVGTAVYNVTPEKAGKYFVKIQCFCFTQQVLRPQESADLPVAFYVDPAIVQDRDLDDVRVITLSYTFYKAQSQAFAAAVDAEVAGAAAAKSPAKPAADAAALDAARRVE